MTRTVKTFSFQVRHEKEVNLQTQFGVAKVIKKYLCIQNDRQRVNTFGKEK